jgi:sulfate adenylyltransferase|tara:strand:- start:5811 stop:7001 length:1191 start_codon:yes stop_codon:yes gene_type:complete
MIKPHGSKELKPLFVSDAANNIALVTEAESLPSLLVNSAAAANAVMLGAGYFNPLTGYMNLADSLAVAENLHTVDGLFWPVPIVNLSSDISAIGDAKRIALRDPNVEGNPVLAIMDIAAIEQVSAEQIDFMAENIFGNLDENHPGVAAFKDQGNILLSGPIQVLNYSYFQKDFPDTFRTAYAIRNEMAARGWNKVVAFQTRNPMHRAHEELCRMAQQDLQTDGILIHMLLGKLKAGDIPADVRDDCIRTMVDIYFPENTVMVTGYGFDMLYAGPREAVLHAVFRQNCGCTHLIVGRDHAGVGDYYGGFDAQTIFDEKVPAGSLEIEIYRADHTAYSKKLDKVIMMKDAPDHDKDDFILLSGTKVREMLGNGIAPPPEFSRPECAKILMDYYQTLES